MQTILYNGRNYPSLAKRGEGRFSEDYFSIMDSLAIEKRQ
jgi:hypothetical protein